MDGDDGNEDEGVGSDHDDYDDGDKQDVDKPYR